MKKKRSKKPDSARDKAAQKKLLRRSVEGLDKLYESIVLKIENNQAPRDEEIRFMKKYEELRSIAIDREKDIKKGKETLPLGKMRDFIEKYWVQKEILEQSGYTKDKEGYEQMFRDFGYYRCKCNELHKQGEDCPFKTLIKKHKISIKAPTNKELDSLLD